MQTLELDEEQQLWLSEINTRLLGIQKEVNQLRQEGFRAVSAAPDEEASETRSSGAPRKRITCSILWAVYLLGIIVAVLITHPLPSKDFVIAPPCQICGPFDLRGNNTYMDPLGQKLVKCGEAALYCQDCAKCGGDCSRVQDFFQKKTTCCDNGVYANVTAQLTPGNLAFAINLGFERQFEGQASCFVNVALLAVVGSAFTSAIVVTFSPHRTPEDFNKKGTLSNVSQDIKTPHGRLFTVALFLAGILQISSQYTFWLYRNWIPRLDFAATPFIPPHAIFEDVYERFWRTLWVMAPHVGLMLTAAIPSLSVSRLIERTMGRYSCALTLVHNVAAPLSVAFLLIMETVQISYGERAFDYFFSHPPPEFYYGPLTSFQRYRVVAVVYAWLAIIIFFGVQVYFGLGDVLGMFDPRNYSLALLSFYSEVTALILVFLLPALAGLEFFAWNLAKGSVMDVAQDAVLNGPWGAWPPVNISNNVTFA